MGIFCFNVEELFKEVSHPQILSIKIVQLMVGILKSFNIYEEIKLIGQSCFSLVFSGYNIKKFRPEAIKVISFEQKKKEAI